MLVKESLWFRDKILGIDAGEGSLILNFGSQSSKYLKQQPFITQNILLPCQTRNFRMLNFDLMQKEGVDISGNIINDETFDRLKTYPFKMIFICNVLEHVTDRDEICRRIERLISSGSYIFVSVPFDFPIHYDPIDTMFRPQIKEIGELFQNCSVVNGEIVEDHSLSYYFFHYYILQNPIDKLKSLLQKDEISSNTQNDWKKMLRSQLNYLNKNFKITCAILKKN